MTEPTNWSRCVVSRRGGAEGVREAKRLVAAGGIRGLKLHPPIQCFAPNDRLVCAAPSYLARAGTPRHPTDLRQHACIALRQNDADVTLWRFTRKGRDAVNVLKSGPAKGAEFQLTLPPGLTVAEVADRVGALRGHSRDG